MENGQFEKALPLLEISLASMRENLPGDHLDMANGEKICILLYWRVCMTINKKGIDCRWMDWFVCPQLSDVCPAVVKSWVICREPYNWLRSLFLLPVIVLPTTTHILQCVSPY